MKWIANIGSVNLSLEYLEKTGKTTNGVFHQGNTENFSGVIKKPCSSTKSRFRQAKLKVAGRNLIKTMGPKWPKGLLKNHCPNMVYGFSAHIRMYLCDVYI